MATAPTQHRGQEERTPRHRRRRTTTIDGVDEGRRPSSRPPALLLIAAVALCLMLLPTPTTAARLDPAPREEAFIGWNGESYHPGGGGGGGAPGADDGLSEGYAPGEGPVATASSSSSGSNGLPPHVEVLSWKPRAFLYRNFLNASEARHFQRAAARVLRHSTVVGDKGESVLRGDYRTSYGCFLRRKSDEVMSAVSKRASALVGIPELYAEDMQVLRYSCVVAEETPPRQPRPDDARADDARTLPPQKNPTTKQQARASSTAPTWTPCATTKQVPASPLCCSTSTTSPEEGRRRFQTPPPRTGRRPTPSAATAATPC